MKHVLAAVVTPLVAVLLAAAGSGCASSGKRGEDLMTDVRSFQEGLRWRRYDQAAEHVPAAARTRFLDAHDDLDADLRVDDYEVVRVTMHGANDATVRVRYTWHLDSVGRVFESTFDQEWQHQGKIWRVVASRQHSGEAMPRDTMPDDTGSATASGGR